MEYIVTSKFAQHYIFDSNYPPLISNSVLVLSTVGICGNSTNQLTFDFHNYSPITKSHLHLTPQKSSGSLWAVTAHWLISFTGSEVPNLYTWLKIRIHWKNIFRKIMMVLARFEPGVPRS